MGPIRVSNRLKVKWLMVSIIIHIALYTRIVNSRGQEKDISHIFYFSIVMSVPQVVKIIPTDHFFTALYAFDYFMKMSVATDVLVACTVTSDGGTITIGAVYSIV
jgi:hypothetical protein